MPAGFEVGYKKEEMQPASWGQHGGRAGHVKNNVAKESTLRCTAGRPGPLRPGRMSMGKRRGGGPCTQGGKGTRRRTQLGTAARAIEPRHSINRKPQVNYKLMAPPSLLTPHPATVGPWGPIAGDLCAPPHPTPPSGPPGPGPVANGRGVAT